MLADASTSNQSSEKRSFVFAEDERSWRQPLRWKIRKRPSPLPVSPRMRLAYATYADLPASSCHRSFDRSGGGLAPLKPYAEVEATGTVARDLVPTLQASSRKPSHWHLEIDDEVWRGRVLCKGTCYNAPTPGQGSRLLRRSLIAGRLSFDLGKEALKRRDDDGGPWCRHGLLGAPSTG